MPPVQQLRASQACVQSAFSPEQDERLGLINKGSTPEDDMKTFRAAMIGLFAVSLSVAAHAQEFRVGTITGLDEVKGTIAIAEASTGTVGSSAADAGQEFKLQDGLMFNALNAGDRISYTVEDVGGLKTVTKVERQ